MPQKKEVVFDLVFEAPRTHLKRRWLQRFYDTEEYRNFVKNTFSPGDQKLYYEATEKMLLRQEFSDYIVEQVKHGRVVRSYDSQRKYLVYAENKFYIVQYEKTKNAWLIKTVLTPKMILEKNYIKKELLAKVY